MMEKTKLSPWVYKLKTLPHFQPRFASSLCATVSLWMVFIPILVLASHGTAFSLKKLIFPVLGAFIFSAIIFSFWKSIAQQVVASNITIDSFTKETLEQKLTKTATFAARIQTSGTLAIVILLGLRHATASDTTQNHFKLASIMCAVFGLILSLILERRYRHIQKQLESMMPLTLTHSESLKLEHRLKFLFPYLFWTIILALCFLLKS